MAVRAGHAVYRCATCHDGAVAHAAARGVPLLTRWRLPMPVNTMVADELGPDRLLASCQACGTLAQASQLRSDPSAHRGTCSHFGSPQPVFDWPATIADRPATKVCSGPDGCGRIVAPNAGLPWCDGCDRPQEEQS